MPGLSQVHTPDGSGAIRFEGRRCSEGCDGFAGGIGGPAPLVADIRRRHGPGLLFGWDAKTMKILTRKNVWNDSEIEADG
jgi:hypothetical protein